MKYDLYNTIEGPVKVYRDAGFEYYVDVDNRYDDTFDCKAEFDDFMSGINAKYVGTDRD